MYLLCLCYSMSRYSSALQLLKNEKLLSHAESMRNIFKLDVHLIVALLYFKMDDYDQVALFCSQCKSKLPCALLVLQTCPNFSFSTKNRYAQLLFLPLLIDSIQSGFHVTNHLMGTACQYVVFAITHITRHFEIFVGWVDTRYHAPTAWGRRSYGVDQQSR